MAERPVFVPLREGRRLFVEVPVDFRWHSGMAPVQKRKNVEELHHAAKKRGLNHLLEVSSKSDLEIGRRLSAFHQTILIEGKAVPLECAFQGSKVFQNGGPYQDLFWIDPREAKRDERLRNSGKLKSFYFDGKEFPLSPPTVFYDWMYANSIFPAREWLRRLSQLDGFTDIEFNPEKSLNCQARSCAIFVALEQRGELDSAMTSFEHFRDHQMASAI